jgi:hypothetical protein
MFTSQQKMFIVQCYFRNGESSYSTPLVFEESQQKFPDFQALTDIQWTQFVVTNLRHSKLHTSENSS